MELPANKRDEIGNDIEKRLEGLNLDDKWYDDFRILKRLDQTEPATEEKSET